MDEDRQMDGWTDGKMYSWISGQLDEYRCTLLIIMAKYDITDTHANMQQ